MPVASTPRIAQPFRPAPSLTTTTCCAGGPPLPTSTETSSIQSVPGLDSRNSTRMYAVPAGEVVVTQTRVQSVVPESFVAESTVAGM